MRALARIKDVRHPLLLSIERIEVTHGIVANPNQVAAHYFEKSGEMNLADPDPSEWDKAWFFDHPTRKERVHFVATYNPWAEGKEPEYVK